MYVCSVWRPISAMSISKSPQSTDVWLRSAFLSVLMLYCMLEIHLIHAICGTFTSKDSTGWTYELNPAILVIETYDNQI